MSLPIPQTIIDARATAKALDEGDEYGDVIIHVRRPGSVDDESLRQIIQAGCEAFVESLPDSCAEGVLMHGATRDDETFQFGGDDGDPEPEG